MLTRKTSADTRKPSAAPESTSVRKWFPLSMRRAIVQSPARRKKQRAGFLSPERGYRAANQQTMKAKAMKAKDECPLGQERQKSPSATPLMLGLGKYI